MADGNIIDSTSSPASNMPLGGEERTGMTGEEENSSENGADSVVSTQDSPSVSNGEPASPATSSPVAAVREGDGTLATVTRSGGVVTPEAARASNTAAAENESTESERPRNSHFLTAPAEWSSHHLRAEQETESSSRSTSTTSRETRPKTVFQRLCASRRRVLAASLAGFLLVAVVLVVAIVLPLSNNNKNTTPNNPNKDSGGIVYDPHDVARMHSFLLQQNWSDPLTLFDPVSPQTRAMHHLAMLYTNTEQELNATRIQQEYALLVVWFGLGGTVVPTFAGHECQEWKPLVDCNNNNQVVALKMWRQGLTGRILEEVALLDNLEFIDMYENMIQGPLPTALYKLTKLTTLQLGKNAISSELSEDIGQLTNLEYLHLHDNTIFGTLSTSLRLLTSLKVVQLWRTQLEGPIVEYIVDWPNLEDLTIAENELFDGTIPSELGTLSNLESFMIQSTSVEGTVPTEVGNLRNLTSFMMGHQLALDTNAKTPFGTLPSEIGNCRKLASLAIEASRMTGTLPATVGNLTSLETLRFKGAQFSGTIPDSIQNLVNLTSLVLQGNSFTGTLPEWLGTSLTNLEYLTVYWNNFSGNVPESLCRANLQFYYDCHNPCDCCGLCGPVEPGVT